MKRRAFLFSSIAAGVTWPLSVSAQQAAMPVVGFLGVSSPEAFSPRLAAFRKGLAQAGFVENRNVEIEYRWANDEADRLPALAAELVRRNVSVIATGGGPGACAGGKSRNHDHSDRVRHAGQRPD